MTSNSMAHELARETLEAFALDALDGPERTAVLAHVARCTSCQVEVADLQSAAAQLSYVVLPVPMPDAQSDRIRARLLARAAADNAAGGIAPAHAVPAVPATSAVRRATPTSNAATTDNAEFHPSPAYHIMVPRTSPAAEAVLHPKWQWRDTKAVWFALAASVIAVGSMGALYQVVRERNGLATAYEVAARERFSGTAVADSLRTVLADRERLIKNLTGPRVAVVTLTSSGAKAPSARMFWDQSADAWTFVAHNLPTPRPGRAYQLWLVTADRKISAGTFSPTTTGDAVVRATYPLPPDALAAVAVTDEPAAGSPQPTTVPFIAGVKSAR